MGFKKYKASRGAIGTNNGKAFKKRTKYRNYGDKASTTIIRSPSAITDSTIVALQYSLNAPINSGVNPGVHIMRGNSCFDPSFTGVGHQPLGFDEWGTFYNNYIVYGCGWVASMLGDGSNVMNAAIVTKPSSTAITDFDTIKERPYSNYAMLGLQGSSNHIRRLSGYQSTKKMYGLKELSNSEDVYGAGMTANPSFQWFIHLYVQHIDRITAVTANVEATFTYYVKFFNRKNLAQS